jgi:hypothetical protein
VKRLALKSFVATALVTVSGLLGLSGVAAAAPTDLLSGQYQTYSVTLRGNNEAVVYAKLALGNNTGQPLTSSSFTMPSQASPSELVIYQMTAPRVCTRYDYNIYSSPCLNYDDPDYLQPNYYAGPGNTYKKIDYVKSGNKYSFDLPTAIKADKSGMVIVAYAAKGFVTESFGLHNFKFETLKVTSRVKQADIYVDVDSDQMLRGAKSTVNYSTSAKPTAALDSVSGTGAAASSALDTIVNGFYSNSGVTKSVKNMAPGESATVTGEYATSWWRLYLAEILWSLLVVVAILVAAVFASRWSRRRRPQAPVASKTSRAKAGAPVASVAAPAAIRFDLSAVVLSLVSTVLVTGLTYLLQQLSNNTLIANYNYNYNPFITAMVAVVAVVVYAVIVVGPAVYLAIKRGWSAVAVYVASELLWLVVITVIAAVLFQNSAGSVIYPMSTDSSSGSGIAPSSGVPVPSSSIDAPVTSPLTK